MNGVRALMLTIVCVACAACGGRSESSGVLPEDSASPLDPTEQTEILQRPFTAGQIRDEWVEGFTVVMRRSTPDAARLERWTVVGADRDRVAIEFATIADDGTVIGEPVVQESTWEDLRDHAAFPAAAATREWVARDTALGAFEGWLYRVRDEEPGSVTEFFFVPELPGAPVEMHVFEGDQEVLVMEQLERSRAVSE